MKRILLPLLAAITLGDSPDALAEGFFVAIGVGGGDISIDETLFATDEGVALDDESDVVVGELLAGYEFANDLFVEAGIQAYDTISIFGLGEIRDLDAVRVGAGGYLPSESRLRFFGKAGLTFWNLTTRESLVFNPGPEEETEIDGTDLFVEAGVEFRFTESFRAGLSIEYANLDFGSSSAVKLTLKFVP